MAAVAAASDEVFRVVGQEITVQQLPVGVADAPMGERKQDRGLGRSQVVAGGLAGASRVPPHAQDVVANREGLAQQVAVVFEQGDQGRRGICGQRAQLQRAGDRVPAALEPGDPTRGCHLALAAGGLSDVEELPLDQLDGHPPPERPHRRAASATSNVASDRARSPSKVATLSPKRAGSPSPAS